MDPNAYAPMQFPPTGQPPAPHQAGPPTGYAGGPPTLNGNYQHQLTASMGGMSLKQDPAGQRNMSMPQPNSPSPPQLANPGLSNGPPPMQKLPPPGMPSGLMTNNNLSGGNANISSQAQRQPPSSYPAPGGGMFPQTAPGGHGPPPTNANLPGMPHMPEATPRMPPMPTQQPMSAQPPPPTHAGPYAGANQQSVLPPPQLQPNPIRAPPSFGAPPAHVNQMPSYTQQQPGYPPAPSAQNLQQQPGYPPVPSGQQQPGYPPVSSGQQQPGYPPAPSGQQQQPGYPPAPSGQQQPGFPPAPSGQNFQQQPGYPPSQPGQNAMPPQPGQPMQNRVPYNQMGPAQVYQQQPQYSQAPRRLDPDQMPNPIQVMIENQRNTGGAFVTNQPGLLPPLVTTKFVVQDQGNSSPRFIRSSIYCVPASADLLKTTALPFNIIVSPYARTVENEYEPPIVDFGELGPIRCNRCKAYMSPNMQFVDAGRRFQCLMCKVSTEVPTEYFQHLDHTGQRVDKYERPELVLGTYEFLAPKDYCRNNAPPEAPAFIFVIDVSYNTIKSGLVHLLCSQMKHILKHLPVDQGQDRSKMRVGFITYNSTVHFYNIKSSLAQPQMMVVGDVQDMFMPLLDGFLCYPEESAAVIDALMEQIPKMFVDTKETETILYPAIQAGLESLKASNCAGKLLVFNSTLPIAEAPGKLKSRDDRKLLGTEKERTVLTPQNAAYNTLGQECVQNGCSVDLFLFNNTYIDIATIGQVSRLTGGEVFKYTYFQADSDGKRLIEDIAKNISRPIAFDAVMRVRTSTGIRATDFYGHFFMTNTTDVELASIDSTKAIAIEIKHDDKLPVEENVYLQIALLFTSCSGQRRLRIINLALTATNTIADVFKSCDLDAMILFFAKQACFKLLELNPKAVKDNLIHRSAQILACYRKHCTSPTSAGQLILPECLKLLPLYVSCLIKNDAISGGSDMTLDDRSFVMQFVLAMDLNMSVHYLYPRLIPIHNVDPDSDELPMSIRCTHEKMSDTGAYILENGVYLFVWLGQSLPQSFVQPLFGVQCTQQVNAERFAITGDTPLAHRVQGIIEMIMAERTRYMRITCVRQNDKMESVFRHFLIEDRGTDGSASYVDFLCHMHKEIKDLLS